MIITEVGGVDLDYYYIVGDNKTSSKNQALLWANGDKSKIYFYCMDNVWDNTAWHVEPEKSINQLCQERCIQLRGQYDWLCVWLSGGYDSQTVLQSFIDAKIPIDEIAYMDRLDYYNDPEVPFILSAVENYKRLHNPNVRLFRAPIGYQYTRDVYQKLGDEWILEPGWCHRPSKSIAPFIHRFSDDVVRRRISTKGRRADIYGKEKPKLDFADGKWFYCNTDITFGDSIGADIIGFYTTPDMPELNVKQCYLAIKFFESLEECSHQVVHEVQSNTSKYYERWNLSLGRKIIDCTVSKHGINKFYFNQKIDSPESALLIKHFQTEDNTVAMIGDSYTNFLTGINGTDPNKPIISKRWEICNFGNHRIEI
jgi:hypothetical protein